MRVTFINRLTTGECIGRVPLGILYLSTALKQRGHQIQIVATGPEGRMSKQIAEFRPDLLLYSVRTGYHKAYIRLNRRLKELYPQVFSVFGGNHPTFYPQMIVREMAIDAVCVGEGEEAICDFVDRFERKADYEKTPNFWVRRDGEIHQNGVRRLIEPMESIGRPDRDLLDGFPSVRTFPVRNFITTRGCPYDCTYCFNFAYYGNIYKGLGKRVRRRPVADVVDEIREEYRKHPFQCAQFEDDIFVYDTRWIGEFAEEYGRRIGLPFSCNVRAEIMDDERSALLKQAGCHSVWMGVEAGDEQVRKDLLGRRNSDSVTVHATRTMQKHGIHVVTENILGVPRTNLGHDLRTLDFNLELRPSFANPSVFQPYPQTPLGDIARDEGTFSGDFDDIPDFYEGSCLAIRHAREVVNLEYLFSLTVEFPWLRPLIPRLMKLPLGAVYKRLMLAYKGYVLTQRVVPVKLGVRHFAHVARRALTVQEAIEF